MNHQKIRADLVDYGNKLFFNSAGASLVPRSVNEKIIEYLHREERLGGYTVAEQQATELDQFYTQAAELIGCEKHNIAFAHSASSAFMQAISSIPLYAKDVIVTSEVDYTSNFLQFLSLHKKRGVITKIIRSLPNGDLDLDHFQQLINQYPVKLVAVTHIPTNSGMVQDVAKVGEICANENLIFLLDSCQSIGQMDVNLKNIKCDFLTATGRKFLRGPRGTGFLYVSDRILNQGYAPLLLDGGNATWTGNDTYQLADTAERFGSWEKPYAMVAGLTEALRYLNDIGIQNIEKQNGKIMRRLRNNLAAIPSVTCYDLGTETSNILTFRKNGKTQEEINRIFSEHQVYYGISQKHQGQIDFGNKGIDWVVRLSPHYFNTLEEMDQIAEIIETM